MSYYEKGIEHDLADGFPSGVRYAKTGEVYGGYSSIKGQIAPAQTIAMIKAAQVCRVSVLLSNSDQSVVPIGMPLPENLVKPVAIGAAKDGR